MQIYVRHEGLAAEPKTTDDLAKLVDGLSVHEGNQKPFGAVRPDTAMTAASNSVVPAIINTGPDPPCHPLAAPEPLTMELHMIQAAMRKLREAIISSGRIDEFARDVYMYIVRAMITTSNWEGYMPALLHLLLIIDRRVPMTEWQRREFAGYWILDLACRQVDLEQAFRVQCAYQMKHEPYINEILISLTKMDSYNFFRLRDRVRGHQRIIMSFCEKEMCSHALKGIARTYFTVERTFLERSVGGRTWDELVAAGVGWELSENGKTVTVRRPKAKSKALPVVKEQTEK
jgi:hypothetical protein